MKLIASLLTAATLWFFMFSLWTAPYFNFWVAMTLSAVLLTCMSLFLSPKLSKQFQFTWKAIGVGILSAAILWVIFYLGDFFSNLLFNFARPQVDSIYAMKDGQSRWILALLLFFIIGPAEEIYWRGYIQRNLAAKMGEWKGFALTTVIYALVHIWSFNFMLIMAALICGAFWGLMYRYNKNLVPVVISHAVWDVAVFILFPIS